MKKIQLFFLFFFVLAAPWAFSLASASQTDAQATIQNLEALVQSMNNLSRMISATREVMKGADGIGREKELKARLDEFQMKLQVMEGSFEQLSAGMGVDALQKEKEAGVDWNREFTEFLAPIMSQVKKMLWKRLWVRKNPSPAHFKNCWNSFFKAGDETCFWRFWRLPSSGAVCITCIN